jgi:hypothetical protein
MSEEKRPEDEYRHMLLHAWVPLLAVVVGLFVANFWGC